MIGTMNETYLLSYHQIRVLALLSLIVSHVLSFSNQMHQIPLETIHGFTGIAFFSTFGVLFIPIAGAAFRIAMDPAVRHHRLRGPIQWAVFKPLFFLLVVDSVKDYLIYRDVEYFFHWTFLKTLLLAWMVIEVFARIHIGALFAVGLAMTLKYSGFVSWTERQKFTYVDVLDQLLHLNFVHGTLFLCLAAPLTWMTLVTVRSEIPRVLKLWVLLLTSAVFSAGSLRILSIHPTLESYLFFRNWFWLGLNGNAATSNLYPALAWIPSVINAFVVTDLALSFKPNPKLRVEHLAPITLALAVISFLIYRRFNTPPQNLINVWDIPTFKKSSIAIEFFKLMSLVNLFACAAYLNTKIKWGSLRREWVTLSQASFIVYILCTTLALWVSGWLAKRMNLFWATTNGTIALTIASYLAAQAAEWVSSKKIRLKLLRA